MAQKLAPFTFFLTSAPSHIGAHLAAHWPAWGDAAACTAAIQDIAAHIRSYFPGAEQKQEVVVCLTNDVEQRQCEAYNFLYDLSDLKITEKIVTEKAESGLLLRVSFLDASRESEDSATFKLAQWQKDAYKTMLQIMAETPPSPTALPSMRDALSGLSHLHFLLLAKNVSTKQHEVAQIMTRTDLQQAIASSVDGIRHSLSALCTGQITSSTSQIKIRGRLNKLETISRLELNTSPRTKAITGTNKSPQALITMKPAENAPVKENLHVISADRPVQPTAIRSFAVSAITQLSSRIIKVKSLLSTPSNEHVAIIKSTEATAVIPGTRANFQQAANIVSTKHNNTTKPIHIGAEAPPQTLVTLTTSQPVSTLQPANDIKAPISPITSETAQPSPTHFITEKIGNNAVKELARNNLNNEPVIIGRNATENTVKTVHEPSTPPLTLADILAKPLHETSQPQPAAAPAVQENTGSLASEYSAAIQIKTLPPEPQSNITPQQNLPVTDKFTLSPSRSFVETVVSGNNILLSVVTPESNAIADMTRESVAVSTGLTYEPSPHPPITIADILGKTLIVDNAGDAAIAPSSAGLHITPDVITIERSVTVNTSREPINNSATAHEPFTSLPLKIADILGEVLQETPEVQPTAPPTVQNVTGSLASEYSAVTQVKTLPPEPLGNIPLQENLPVTDKLTLPPSRSFAETVASGDTPSSRPLTIADILGKTLHETRETQPPAPLRVEDIAAEHPVATQIKTTVPEQPQPAVESPADELTLSLPGSFVESTTVPEITDMATLIPQAQADFQQVTNADSLFAVEAQAEIEPIDLFHQGLADEDISLSSVANVVSLDTVKPAKDLGANPELAKLKALKKNRMYNQYGMC